jgi:hypothetical protein
VTPGPHASGQDAGGQPGVHPASPQPAPLRLRSAGGRVGRRPIPQGRAAPFRRPAQSERLLRVWGRVLSSGQRPRRSLRRPESAHSPQMVRKTARNGQHHPTAANDESPAQGGFSATAHCAKPPRGRFCKAGVRGSIPLVSTHRVLVKPDPASGHAPQMTASGGRRMFHVERSRRPVGRAPRIGGRVDA